MHALRAFLRTRRGALVLGLVILAEFVVGLGTWTARRDGGSPSVAAKRQVNSEGSIDAVEFPQDSSTSTAAATGASTPAARRAAGVTAGPTSPVRRPRPDVPVPAPPRSVRVSAGAGVVTISWDRVPGNVTLYAVRAFEAQRGYSGLVFACGTCTSAAFRALTNGSTYSFVVSARNEGGESSGTRSPSATPHSDLCPSGPCLAVDGAATQGAAIRRAQGLLHGVATKTDMQRFGQLNMRSWRGSGGLEVYRLVAPYAPRTTQILSDYWFKDNADPRGGSVAPWEDWNRYTAYVINLVLKAKREGWAPTWWDVQDEPDYGLPYHPGADVTLQNTLDVYKVGYQAIKTADPTAKVIGPTLMGFLPDPDAKNPRLIDVSTFLNYAAQNGVKFDGLVWHETAAAHLNPHDWTAESVVDHVDAVRAMLSQWPALGQPAILVNEYTQLRDLTVPGWSAGYISAMERADVDEANVTCGLGADVANCFIGTLAGLVASDRTTPRAAWWVHRFYGQMTGARLDTTSSVPLISGFATTTGGEWKVLVGRHQSCTKDPNWRCDQPTSATPPPTGFTVAIRVGGGDRDIQASVNRIPNTIDDVPALAPPDTQVVPVRDGVARVSIPAFADGEAYFVSVS